MNTKIQPESGTTLACKNCGAPITFSDEVCPFCGAKNEDAAEHIQTKQTYVARSSRFLAKNRLDVEVSAGILVRAVALLILILTVIIGIVALARYDVDADKRKLKEATGQQQEIETEMLSLWDEGDYYSFYGYCDEEGIASYTAGAFARYQGLIRTAECYIYINDSIINYQMTSSNAKKLEEMETVGGLLVDFYNTSYMNAYGRENGMTDQEYMTYAKPVYKEMETILSVYFNLTEEETDSLSQASSGEIIQLLEKGAARNE